MKKLLKIILSFSIFFFIKDVYAKTSNGVMLKFNNIEITESTTIEQVISMYGEDPILVTDNAWKGKSYTFYKENYSDILYIETLPSGQVMAYGALGVEFESQYFDYSDGWDNNVYFLGGYQLIDTRPSTREYYTRGVFGYNQSIIRSNYKAFLTEFEKDQARYEKYISLHATAIANSNFSQKGTEAKFDESLYDKLKRIELETGEEISKFASNNKKSGALYCLNYSSLSSVGVYLEYLPNPMVLVGGTFNYTLPAGKDYSFMSFHIKSFESNGYRGFVSRCFTTKDIILKHPESVSLTTREKQMYNAAKNLYKDSVSIYNQSNGELWDVEPTYSQLPLVAGVLKNNIHTGITMFLNAIRAAAGLPELEESLELAEIAGHKAALVNYINNVDKTGNENANMHNPNKPDGVSDEFYSKTHYIGGENLYYTGVITQSPLNSIANAIGDVEGDPIMCGHRYNLLDPSYKYFGYGQADRQGVHEFSGSKSNDIDVVAWPSNGITPLEAYKNCYWTVRFYNNYSTTSTTSLTITRLSDNKVWNLSSSNNNVYIYGSLISFYVSDITVADGDGYTIIVDNLKDNSGNITSYEYRTVFKYIYGDSLEPQYPSSISTNKTSYIGVVGEYENIGIALNDEATDNILEFTSSNPDVASVNQFGRIEYLSSGTSTITIKALNDVSYNVNVVVNDYLKGDLNRNNEIDLTDILIELKLFFNKNADQTQLIIGDMNDDGDITLSDILMLLKLFFNK